jgi:hypothetical protein
MKTTSQNIEGAREQIRNTQQAVGTAATDASHQSHPSYSDRKDSRNGSGNLPPIDSEARKANRTLPTPKVLTLLHQQLPAAYRLAEVVGKWVWVHFKEQPAPEIRQSLAQLGFHWNRERQAWQHPCGQFSLSSSGDPHEKYSSYYPARIRRSAKAQTPAALACGAATAA